jgi:hypothetical protein
MPRASESQKAERLNRARDLLLHVDQLSDRSNNWPGNAPFRRVKPIATSSKLSG